MITEQFIDSAKERVRNVPYKTLVLNELVLNYEHWRKEGQSIHGWPHDEYVAERVINSELALFSFIKYHINQ